MGLPSLIYNLKAKRQQCVKERLVKNSGAILDAMAENVKGARACPILMGQKCIGIMCENFMKFTTTDGREYYRCAHNAVPTLQIEALNLLRQIINQNSEMIELLKQRG